MRIVQPAHQAMSTRKFPGVELETPAQIVLFRVLLRRFALLVAHGLLDFGT
jgi:hypothetical protein